MQPHGGVSRYWFELLREMAIQAPGQIRGYTGLNFTDLPIHELAPEISILGLRLPFVPNRGRRLIKALSSIPCKLILSTLRPSIYHPTYYDFHASPLSTKRVVTVHDFISEKFWGHNHPSSVAKKKSLESADHLICVSHSTRNDLIYYFPHLESRSSVIHHGIRDLPFANHSPPLESPFFLYVGMRGGYKNFALLIDAINLLVESGHHDLGLVCFGGEIMTADEQYKLGNIRFKHIMGSDHLLASAYHSATAIVYPSRYEGFGLPLLEAMQCDCPVICSKTSSLPEIAGESALYFHPDAADELAEQMRSLIDKPEIREKLIRAGRQRLFAFSWSKAAIQTLLLYKSLESNSC